MSDANFFPAEAEQAALHTIEQMAARGTVHDVMHEGLRMRWRRFGPTGATPHPPLVLLHGGHGSWMHWLRNINALSADRVLWLPDLPGFLDSDTPPIPAAGTDPLGPALAATIATLDQLVGAGTSIDLGGFSFGGLFAARLAAARGAVRRLVLIGSGGHDSIRRMSVEMINWRAATSREEERAALRHNLMALMLHDPKALDALAFVIHDLSCHGTRFRSKDVSLAGGLEAALDRSPIPQLLVWGEQDVTAEPRSLLKRLTEGHPERRSVVVEDAGHWTQFERPGEINRLLKAFL